MVLSLITQLLKRELIRHQAYAATPHLADMKAKAANRFLRKFQAQSLVCILLVMTGFAFFFAIQYAQVQEELRTTKEELSRIEAKSDMLRTQVNEMNRLTTSLKSLNESSQDSSQSKSQIFDKTLVSKEIPSVIKERFSNSSVFYFPSYAPFSLNHSLLSISNIDPLKTDFAFKPLPDMSSQTSFNLDESFKLGENIIQRLRGFSAMMKVKSNYFDLIPSILPAQGTITSGFGIRSSPFGGTPAMHAGMDIASEVGTVIYAPADGVVTYVGNYFGLGNALVLTHGFGIQTRYGHNSKVLVKAGQKIKRGTPVAHLGMSGLTTGPHLHYEVWINGTAVDPAQFIFDPRNLRLHDPLTQIQKSVVAEEMPKAMRQKSSVRFKDKGA